MPHLAHIALIIRDYDEALAFYVGKLGFELVEDIYQPEQNKRWVTIRPPSVPDNATTIIVARASTDHQAKYIGDQVGGGVFLFVFTDDIARDHARFTAVGVAWVCAPAIRAFRHRRGLRHAAAARHGQGCTPNHRDCRSPIREEAGDDHAVLG